MKCPYCKKEIKEKEKMEYLGVQITNIFIPTIIIMSIGQLIEWLFKIDIFPITAILMMIIGIFYLIYGFLWEFGKVKGRLFISNLWK